MDYKKPLIGVTCNYDYRDALSNVTGVGAPGQDWNYVAGDYVYALEKAGALPVLIPLYRERESALAFLDRLDGLLISGGHDVGPERYGAFPKACCGTVFPMRDEQDLTLAKAALERDLPLLGVCRGTQILNVACGGTLYQDLESEGGFEHHSGGERYPRNTPWHRVTLEEGSVPAEIFGKTELTVNSYHHQAVRVPGEGVRVVGRSVDGVCEAITVEGRRFALAVQWHPEMMFDSAEQGKLLRAFVEHCR